MNIFTCWRRGILKDGESELPLIINESVSMHSLSENKGMRVLEMNDDDDDENLDLLGDFKS